jgi:hypothetical protein
MIGFHKREAKTLVFAVLDTPLNAGMRLRVALDIMRMCSDCAESLARIAYECADTTDAYMPFASGDKLAVVKDYLNGDRNIPIAAIARRATAIAQDAAEYADVCERFAPSPYAHKVVCAANAVAHAAQACAAYDADDCPAEHAWSAIVNAAGAIMESLSDLDSVYQRFIEIVRDVLGE